MGKFNEDHIAKEWSTSNFCFDSLQKLQIDMLEQKYGLDGGDDNSKTKQKGGSERNETSGCSNFCKEW